MFMGKYIEVKYFHFQGANVLQKTMASSNVTTANIT